VIKPKSVAYYFDDGMGGMRVVSKNAVTRMHKKLRSKDAFKPGQIYAMPIHKVKGKK